jgi:hypothetical protein
MERYLPYKKHDGPLGWAVQRVEDIAVSLSEKTAKLIARAYAERGSAMKVKFVCEGVGRPGGPPGRPSEQAGPQALKAWQQEYDSWESQRIVKMKVVGGDGLAGFADLHISGVAVQELVPGQTYEADFKPAAAAAPAA